MNKSEAGRLGNIASKQKQLALYEERISSYDSNPNKCDHCDTAIEYQKRTHKFCSSSCSATSNNSKRTSKLIEADCLGCGTLLQFPPHRPRTYCDHTCQTLFRYNSFIVEWQTGNVAGGNQYGVSRHVRRYLHDKFENKCSVCKIDEWTGQKLTLEVDHIDGNANDHSEANLRLLCPNCHSLTDTFRAKNTGSGRDYRRKLH